MPITETAEQTEIFKGYIRRHTAIIYLAGGEVLRLSRGAVNRNGIDFKNYISAVSPLRQSIDSGIDRMTVECQNVNSELGIKAASNLDLFDWAVFDYGIERQSTRNPALIDFSEQDFRGIAANVEYDETRFSAEAVSDVEAFGTIIASRTLSPRSAWTIQNGIEVTQTPVIARPTTRTHFKLNGVEWEYGGWEGFEEPSSDLPGGGGNIGGGIGEGEIEPTRCFALETPVILPDRLSTIGELPLGKQRETINIVSFNETTGEIFPYDEIDEVTEHEVTGFYTLDFGSIKIRVTGEHPFFSANGWQAVADSKPKDSIRGLGDGIWTTAEIKSINRTLKQNSNINGCRIRVRNLHVRRNRTYFVGNERFAAAVHNKEQGGFGSALGVI